MNQSVGIWMVRSEADALGCHLATTLGAKLYPCRSADGLSNREAFAAVYRNCERWILIMTTGIAVRYLQGLAKDKATDPGVVVLDEAGRFAISLLGGHEGGSNELAYQVANAVGAVPVITTATESLKPLVLGIGCRRDVPTERIEAAVTAALTSIGRKISEVREVATIDLKANEPGLLTWCKQEHLPLRVIRRDQIVDRPWVTQSSDWVRSQIGVDGVCEPCALLATYRGKLIVPKTVLEGVTVAVVEEKSLL